MLKVGKIYKEKATGKLWKCWSLASTSKSFAYFESKTEKCKIFWDYDVESNYLEKLLNGANLSRLSTALGKHRSYLNKLIQVGCSDKTYNKIKDKLTIDWNSDKPLYVNDGKHVPFTIKPISCVLPKHKEWLQSLMMKGCVKL